MKVLFDHNLPHKLRTSLDALGQHEFVTAETARDAAAKSLQKATMKGG